MNKKIFILLSLVAIILAACAPAASRSAPDLYNAPSPAEPFAQESSSAGGNAGDRAATAPGQVTNAYSASLPADASRLVIKNASLSIYVDDPSQSMDRISRMAEAMEGFVVTANLTQMVLDSGVTVPRASITVRVLAERLDEALTTIKAETNQPVINETISSQDVTSEYTDLQSRLRNLEAAEQQLQNIMDQATKTEDVLSVYNQLVSVREQIEVIKGQILYYEQSAALSSVSVELTANQAAQPLKIGGWQPVGVAKDALQILIRTVQALVNIGI